MLKGKFTIAFLICCLVLTCIPAAMCKTSAPPTVYVSGDGTGDFNCDGKADQIEINQALKFVADNPKYTTVHLKGPFTYTITKPIYIESKTILEGDSNAVIKLANNAGWTNSPMTPMIGQRTSVYKVNDISVKGFEINANYAGNAKTPKGKGYYNCIQFKHAKNITVSNMYIHDGHGDGLRIYYGENIKFYNNKISLLGHDGMYTINAKNVEAWNNKIMCRVNSGLRVLDSDNVKLHNNFIDAYPDAGPGIQVQRDGEKMNVEVYENVLTNTYGPGIWVVGTEGAYPANQTNLYIHHNIFKGCGTNKNIQWVGGVLTSGFHNILIENNVFDGTYNSAIVNMYKTDTDVGPAGKGFTVTARNNIITNTVRRGTKPAGTGYAVTNCLSKTHTIVLKNNCLYNNFAGNYKNCASKADIYVNPLFADQKNQDYHLKSSAGRWNGKGWAKDAVISPCIDSGCTSSEYSKEPEPNGDRINIGRYGNTQYASKSK